MCAKGSTVLEFKKQILEDMIKEDVEEAKYMPLNRFVHGLSSHDLFTNCMHDHVTPG